MGLRAGRRAGGCLLPGKALIIWKLWTLGEIPPNIKLLALKFDFNSNDMLNMKYSIFKFLSTCQTYVLKIQDINFNSPTTKNDYSTYEGQIFSLFWCLGKGPFSITVEALISSTINFTMSWPLDNHIGTTWLFSGFIKFSYQKEMFYNPLKTIITMKTVSL